MAFGLTFYEPDGAVNFHISDDAVLECDCDMEAELAAKELGFESLGADIALLWQDDPLMVCTHVADPVANLIVAQESIEHILPLVEARWSDAHPVVQGVVKFTDTVLHWPQHLREEFSLVDQHYRPYPPGLKVFDFVPAEPFKKDPVLAVRSDVANATRLLVRLAQAYFVNSGIDTFRSARDPMELTDSSYMCRVRACAMWCRAAFADAGQKRASRQEHLWQTGRLLELALTSDTGKQLVNRSFDFTYTPGPFEQMIGVDRFSCEGVLRWLSI